MVHQIKVLTSSFIMCLVLLPVNDSGKPESTAYVLTPGNEGRWSPCWLPQVVIARFRVGQTAGSNSI